MGKEKIKSPLKRYKEIFKDLDENKRTFAEQLYKEAIFMNKTLKKLKTSISKEGAIVSKMNGNGFEVITENPAQKAYNSMIKNYNYNLKLLAELATPSAKGESKLEALFGDDE